jgi:hypothetical protein
MRLIGLQRPLPTAPEATACNMDKTSNEALKTVLGRRILAHNRLPSKIITLAASVTTCNSLSSIESVVLIVVCKGEDAL